MKIIAAIAARFSRKKTEEPDHFEQRLRALTAPKPKKRLMEEHHNPALFRRAAHA